MAVRLIHMALLAAVLFSCGRIEDPAVAGGKVVELSLGTKAEAQVGETFRVLNHLGAQSAAKFLLLEGTETYFLKNEGDPALTPCTVGDDGTNPVEKTEVNLGPITSTRRIVMVRPALKHNDDGMGSFSFNPESTQFYSTDYAEKVLGNYGVVNIDSKLYERKTKLNVRVYEKSGSGVAEFEISNVSISGGGVSGESVKFYPVTNMVIVQNPLLGKDVALKDVRSENRTGVSGDRLIYESDPEDPLLLCSGMYVPQQVAASKLGCTDKLGNIPSGGDYLYLECKMKSGNVEADLRVGITSDSNPALDPQSVYNVNLIVMSNYIGVTLDVYDSTGNEWQDGGVGDNTVSSPSYTINLGEWEVADWKVIDAGENKIEG